MTLRLCRPAKEAACHEAEPRRLAAGLTKKVKYDILIIISIIIYRRVNTCLIPLGHRKDERWVFFFLPCGEEAALFREMRRKKQALPWEESVAILEKGTAGVLALSGDEGYPYAVPMSYVYDGKKIYFHCAKSGHKLDAIQRNAKASLCVVARDDVVPEQYTTYYQSVIVFGTLRVLEGESEKRAAIEKLAVKYAPEHAVAARNATIEREWEPLCMLEMTVEHITGKEAKELALAKR